jgi:O-antigen ligase
MRSLYREYISIGDFKPKLVVFLLCLLPLSFALGPLISEIIFLFSFFVFSKEIYVKKNKYYKNYFFLFFLIFYIFIFCNSLFHFFFKTYELDNSLFNFIDHQKSVIFFFRYYLYFVLVWYIFDQIKIFKKLLLFSLIFSLTLVAIDAIIQYFLGVNSLGYPRINLHRLSGIFNDEFILGSYYFRLYFIFNSLFFLLLDIKKNQFNKIYILYNIFFGVLIFLSGERSAFYLFILNIFLSFIFISKIKLKLFIQLSSFLIIFFSVISFFDMQIRDRIFHKTFSQFFDSDKKKFYLFTEVHDGHYMSAKIMFRDNFWFGVGAKNFKIKCKEEKYKYYKSRCATHPHNYYFQLFSELGIFGGLYVLFLVMLIILKLINSLKYKNETKDVNNILLIGFLMFLWPFVPHGNFFNNWIIMTSIISLSFFKHNSYKIY